MTSPLSNSINRLSRSIRNLSITNFVFFVSYAILQKVFIALSISSINAEKLPSTPALFFSLYAALVSLAISRFNEARVGISFSNKPTLLSPSPIKASNMDFIVEAQGSLYFLYTSGKSSPLSFIWGTGDSASKIVIREL